MSAEETVLESLRPALREEVSASDLDRIVVHPGPPRHRSKLYFVGFDGSPPEYRWVVKQPAVDRRQEDLASPMSAAAQFEALQRLHTHLLRGDGAVVAPRPVALMPEIGAYAMEYVYGPTVRDLVGVRAVLRPEKLLTPVAKAAQVLHAVHSVERAQPEIVEGSSVSRTVTGSRVLLHGDFAPENVILTSSGAYCCIDADLAERGSAEKDVARFLMMLFEARLFIMGADVPPVQRLRRSAATAFLTAYYGERPWPESLRPLTLTGLVSRSSIREEQLSERSPALTRARSVMLKRHFENLLAEVSRPEWPECPA